jgi:hypothetical protein
MHTTRRRHGWHNGSAQPCHTRAHARTLVGWAGLRIEPCGTRACRSRAQVREIWLSSEDTGAWGRDIGSSLPELLAALVAELPPDARTLLRVVSRANTSHKLISTACQAAAPCLAGLFAIEARVTSCLRVLPMPASDASYGPYAAPARP